MSDKLPVCPVCNMDDLWLRSRILENGQWHYHVECGSCGTEFHHEKFYGYNSVMKFFEDECSTPSCNNISMTGDENRWLCSECGAKRQKRKDEKAYSFCPDCGAEVTEW